MRRQLFFLGLAASVGSSRPVPAQPDWVTQILQAAQLPVVAAEARKEGMPNSDIGSIIEAARRGRIPAQEAAVILDTARAVRRDHGPIDNFGAFVQAQLESGKRGRELAAAIRAEHARLGKGRGNGNARGGRGQNQGNQTTPGNNAGRGNAASRGRSGAAGRGADSAGRGNTKGRGRSGPPTR